MADIVTPDEFAAAITKALTEYTDEIYTKMHSAVDEVAEEVMAEIKKHISFTPRTWRYIKAFKLKTSFSDKRNKRKTWYVSGEEYRKTHLLEKGHRFARGGVYTGKSAKAYPHIVYGETLADWKLQQLIEKAIKGE